MKKKYLLILNFMLFCCVLNAQNSRDSIMIVKATVEIKEGNLKKAVNYLEKVSTKGKNTKQYLLCRAAYYENGNKLDLAQKDYDTLFVTTGDNTFKIKSEKMQLQQIKQNALYAKRKNCYNCHGVGYVVQNTNCNFCNGSRVENYTCNYCNGLGNEKCVNCGGTGKITKTIAMSNEGVSSKVIEQIDCGRCYGKGSYRCTKCFGNGFIAQYCTQCKGTGIISKNVQCPLHD